MRWSSETNASTRITAITLATSAPVDNEVTLDPTANIGALTRKVRRAIVVSRENARMTLHFTTQDAAGADDANLAKRVELTPYGNQVLEPEKGAESALAFLATATARRLAAYVESVNGADGGALPAGTGVDVELEYYDDVGA